MAMTLKSQKASSTDIAPEWVGFDQLTARTSGHLDLTYNLVDRLNVATFARWDGTRVIASADAARVVAQYETEKAELDAAQALIDKQADAAREAEMVEARENFRRKALSRILPYGQKLEVPGGPETIEFEGDV